MDSAVYPSSAVEQAMKVQEVILRAIDGRLKWYQAAEILGISDRQMRRWKRRYERFGYDGLFDRRRQQPSPKRVPLGVVQQVLTLYRERYFDCNVLHFHEKLQTLHGIPLSYTWVKTALQTAGLVAKEARRGPHRKARPRRPLPGMLLHADASTRRLLRLGPVGGDDVAEVGRPQRVEERELPSNFALEDQAEGRRRPVHRVHRLRELVAAAGDRRCPRRLRERAEERLDRRILVGGDRPADPLGPQGRGRSLGCSPGAAGPDRPTGGVPTRECTPP